MIAFGVCVSSPERFRRYGRPGLSGSAEPDSLIAEVTTDSSIFSAYNEILDALRQREDLEALVLLHDDTEIVDPEFCLKIRRRLVDPELAIVGAVGARGVTSLSWWEAEPFGRVTESRGVLDFGGGTHAVDAVDGLMLVLSPWAVANLRFDDQRYSGFHGYDMDICFQARAAGRKVLVDDLDVLHHTRGGFGDPTAFKQAERTWGEKWLTASARDVQRLEVMCRICGTRLEAEVEGNEHSIVECSTCGVGITLPEPDRNIATDEIFEAQYFGSRLALRHQWFKEAKLRLEWIASFVSPGTILEVGSATGEFVASAALAGWRAFGVEPSLWAAEQARLLGVENIFPTDLETWRSEHPNITVDGVALFHVLEHINEPRDFLRSVGAVLRPGGRLFIEVPNFAAAAARLDPVAWSGVTIDEHVLHYTPAALERLLIDAGFVVEQAEGLTYRAYDSPEVWERRTQNWLAQGMIDHSEDLLRVVAVQPPEDDHLDVDRFRAPDHRDMR